MEKWKATLIRPFYDYNIESKADKPIQGKQYPLWSANGVTNLTGQREERNKRQFFLKVFLVVNTQKRNNTNHYKKSCVRFYSSELLFQAGIDKRAHFTYMLLPYSSCMLFYLSIIYFIWMACLLFIQMNRTNCFYSQHSTQHQNPVKIHLTVNSLRTQRNSWWCYFAIHI